MHVFRRDIGFFLAFSPYGAVARSESLRQPQKFTPFDEGVTSWCHVLISPNTAQPGGAKPHIPVRPESETHDWLAGTLKTSTCKELARQGDLARIRVHFLVGRRLNRDTPSVAVRLPADEPEMDRLARVGPVE